MVESLNTTFIVRAKQMNCMVKIFKMSESVCSCSSVYVAYVFTLVSLFFLIICHGIKCMVCISIFGQL